MFDSLKVNIDDFEVNTIISSNSFCDLCIINDKQTQKLYFGKISKNDENNKNVSQEAETLYKLDHPSIIKLIGYSSFDFNHQSKPVIITEYFKNGTLKYILDQQKQASVNHKLGLTQILKIMYGIATGMAFLHSHQIIHNNLNLDTIYLDDNYLPKITGLNQAEIYSTSKHNSQDILEKREYLKACDVYSYSIIIFQLLVGQISFDKTSNKEEILNSIQKNFLTLQIPQSYKNLIDMCLCEDTKNRPSFDQIAYFLRSNNEFIAEEVNKDEFNEYIKSIKSLGAKYYTRIIQITSKAIDDSITNEMKKQFEKDPNKIKYFLIEKAKKIINEFLLSCKFSNDFNVNFDVDKFQKVLIEKYIELSKVSLEDASTIALQNDLKNIIDVTYNKAKNNYLKELNYNAIKQILATIVDHSYDFEKEKDKIQTKINEIFNNYYFTDFLFNHDKLRQISNLKTPLKYVTKTLVAIQNNFYIEKSLIKETEEQDFSVLFPKEEYAKILSSILTGNCFITSLYGLPSFTRKILSSIMNKDLKVHEFRDCITIYGPVNFESFALFDEDLISDIIGFKERYPNIFFIEISNVISGDQYENICHFLSFISHFIVFCSESVPDESEINHFRNLLITPYNDSILFNLSPDSNIKLIKDDQKNRPIINLSINEIKNNHIRKLLTKEICKNRLNFYPSETIVELAELILDKDLKEILNQDKESFRQQNIENYSNQIRNISYEHFKEEATNYHWQNQSKSNEDIEQLLNKTREFFFDNVYQEYWNNPQIERASKVLLLECKNDFKSMNLRFSRSFSDSEDQNDIIKKLFYSFLCENPTITDEEYGKFVYDFYIKNKFKYGNNLARIAQRIRKTSHKYIPTDFHVSIDQDSFDDEQIEISPSSAEFFLIPTEYCQKLFELVEQKFNLGSIPFHITIDDGDTKKEILKDSTNLYRLNTHYFDVHYGNFKITTKNIIGTLVNPKIIKIDDDFIIKTNCEEAEYKVEYQKNHQGWFDVEFNIQKTNESEENVQDNSLIYLTINQNETSFILDGNSAQIEYKMGDEWVTEEESVFLMYPDCNKVVFPIRHYVKQKLTKRQIEINSEKIDILPQYVNNKYSRNWDSYNGNKAYYRGGRPYYLPVGFQSIGIKVDNFDENTCVGFHGCKVESINSIIKNGFQLPTQVREGHIPLNQKVGGIPNFANAIFASPSIKYAALYGKQSIAISYDENNNEIIYFKVGDIQADIKGKKFYRLIILQVRVKPDSFMEFKNTVPGKKNIDPHYDDSKIEWRIPNPKDIFPYRVLYRFIEINDFIEAYKSKTLLC